MDRVMVDQKCPGGRVERVSDDGAAVLVTCRCGRHAPGEERERSRRADEEEVQVSERKIQTVSINDAFRRTERPGTPATALEREIAAELARPDNEHLVAIVNPTTGAIATVKEPVSHFDQEWYESEMRKKREKGR